MHAKTEGTPHLCDEIKSVLKAVRCVWYLSQQAKTSVTSQISHRNVQWHLNADVAAAVAHKGCRWKRNPLSELYGLSPSLRIRWRPFLMENLTDRFSKRAVFQWQVGGAGKWLLLWERCRFCQVDVGEVGAVTWAGADPVSHRKKGSTMTTVDMDPELSLWAKTYFRPETLQGSLTFYH